MNVIALLTQTQDALREIQWSGYAVIGIEPCPACGNELLTDTPEGCIVAAALDRRLVLNITDRAFVGAPCPGCSIPSLPT